MIPALNSLSAEQSIIGRLAPSPTGGLHLGHARTFLIAWLAARHLGGRVILRIEDLDASRVRAEAMRTAIDDLRWLGLDWDEGPDLQGRSGPYLQSERSSIYEGWLESLKKSERVYPCTCTRADVARAASAPHLEDEGPTYPGTCSHRCVADAERAWPAVLFAWRFRVPRRRWWNGTTSSWEESRLILHSSAATSSSLGMPPAIPISLRWWPMMRQWA